MFKMTWGKTDGSMEERKFADQKEVDIFFHVLMGCSDVIPASVCWEKI